MSPNTSYKIDKSHSSRHDIGMEFSEHIRHGTKARVPNFNAKAQTSFSTLYENSFGVKADRLGNLLPRHVNQQETLTGFKEALGAFLKNCPDTPPITGYTTINSNSLLEWRLVGNSRGGTTGTNSRTSIRPSA